jgi:thymidylate synthase (FAD)
MKLKISQQTVELVDCMGDDLSVVNAARVSFAKQSSWEIAEDGWSDIGLKNADKRLIKYLANHSHWSPFAHTSISLRVKAPIFVARQLVKHQVGGVWNEVSRRYVDSEPEFYIPEPRLKADNVKQGSSDKLFTQYLFTEEFEYVDRGYEEVAQQYIENSLYLSNRMLQAGIAPEVARAYLPQSTMTEWIWTGSLLFFHRVFKQRIDAHAQKETQEIAKMIGDIVAPLFPVSWKALNEDSTT